jgi:TetR/AcrR family transcriptional repressor of nem operon
MARPREFDEEQVLDDALAAFWSRGYEATSITDLMEATGLTKGSLYKAFGDKHALFLVALDRYLANGRGWVGDVLDSSASGRAGLEGWLARVVEMATDGNERGCFAVNCTVELAPHDQEVRARLDANQRRLLSRYRLALERGVREGEFRADLHVPSAAQLIGTVIGGLQVAGKAGLSKRDARRQVRTLLDSFA